MMIPYSLWRPWVEPTPTVTVVLFGAKASGTTTLCRFLRWCLVQRALLSSGLYFSPGELRRVARLQAEGRAAEEDLRQPGPLRTTGLQPEQRLGLQDAGRTLAELCLVDSGRNCLEHRLLLPNADVVWAVVPFPPKPLTRAARIRFEDHLVMLRSFLRDVLACRLSGRQLALCFIFSMADVRYSSAAVALDLLPYELKSSFFRPFQSILDHEGVAEAAALPVSVMGFGQTLCVSGRAAAPDWRLRPDGRVRAWNLETLTVYSLLAALRQRPQRLVRDVPGVASLCQRLERDLQNLGGWLLSLKSA